MLNKCKKFQQKSSCLRNRHNIPVGCWIVVDAATVLVEEVGTNVEVTCTGSANQEISYLLFNYYLDL